MFNVVLAAIFIICGVLGRFLIKQKAKEYEFKATEYDNKASAYETKGEYYKNDADDYRERASNCRKIVSRIKSKAGLSVAGGILLAVIIMAIGMIAIVPTGYTGIKITFGNVEDGVLASGLNIIMPWQNVITMDNRTQKVKLDTQAFSSDIQQVDITLSVNYSIDKETAQVLYKTVGTNYYENVMFPRIQENTKAVFSQYSAENLIEKRNLLSEQIAEATADNMKRYGITIVSVSIENIDFTDAFTDAVEAKQVAAQRKLTAETEQAQKTMEEEAAAKRAIIAENAKAEQAVIAAKADLEVVQIQAEASLYAGQREAEMNQRIAEALTTDLIKYYLIKQWDGKLPIVSSDGMNIINLSDVTNNE